jgi:hypothetical protein
VQASGGAPGRGGVNPLGFSPALLRGGDGRLGRSLDPILLYSQSYHSWTRVSVTAVTFTARSVHSRAADPDTLHFQGSPRLEQGQWRSASCQLWLARLPLPRLQIQSQRGLASLRRHSCLAGACGVMLSCGSLRLSFFVGAIAVVAVGAAEPSVVVDGIALVFRLPRFLYGRGDA